MLRQAALGPHEPSSTAESEHPLHPDALVQMPNEPHSHSNAPSEAGDGQEGPEGGLAEEEQLKRKRGRRGGRKIRLRRLANEAALALEEQEKLARDLGLPKDLVLSAGLPLIVAGMAGGNPRAASELLASQVAAVAASQRGSPQLRNSMPGHGGHHAGPYSLMSEAQRQQTANQYAIQELSSQINALTMAAAQRSQPPPPPPPPPPQRPNPRAQLHFNSAPTLYPPAPMYGIGGMPYSVGSPYAAQASVPENDPWINLLPPSAADASQSPYGYSPYGQNAGALPSPGPGSRGGVMRSAPGGQPSAFQGYLDPGPSSYSGPAGPLHFYGGGGAGAAGGGQGGPSLLIQQAQAQAQAHAQQAQALGEAQARAQALSDASSYALGEFLSAAAAAEQRQPMGGAGQAGDGMGGNPNYYDPQQAQALQTVRMIRRDLQQLAQVQQFGGGQPYLYGGGQLPPGAASQAGPQYNMGGQIGPQGF